MAVFFVESQSWNHLIFNYILFLYDMAEFTSNVIETLYWCINITLPQESSALFMYSTILRVLQRTLHHRILLVARDQNGNTLLHHAVSRQYGESHQLCQLLHELENTLVQTPNRHGWLPVHYACHVGNFDTAKYLSELYPESIHYPDDRGDCPLHFLAGSKQQHHHYRNENRTTLLRSLLLINDDRGGGAVTTPNHDGNLPLHHACCYWWHYNDVKVIFDAYPEAIYVRNNNNLTPLDVANRLDVIYFLERQMRLVRDVCVDPQSVHDVFQKGGLSWGAVKLAVKSNTSITNVSDCRGRTLLHIACMEGNVSIVKYLVDANEESLRFVDDEGNQPLHIACLSGRCHVVNYILDKCIHGVTLQNVVGKTPFELLLLCNDDDVNNCNTLGRSVSLENATSIGKLLSTDSLEYAETIMRLIQLNPSIVESFLTSEELTDNNCVASYLTNEEDQSRKCRGDTYFIWIGSLLVLSVYHLWMRASI